MSAKALLSASLSAPPAVYVEDVFSTYLYTGNGSTQTITNGIDLAGEGGLVWTKERIGPNSHLLYDTNRGTGKYLSSDATNAETTNATTLTSFNSNGFSLGVNVSYNGNGTTYASWTFRKQPKFFDVVTYTGDGAGQGVRAIAHGLTSTPGCIIIKRLDSSSEWAVWHRYAGVTNQDLSGISLNGNGAATGYPNGTTALMNSASFDPANIYGVTGGACNINNATYVAYLFAHDAGGFGDAGTDNVVSCGSFTGTGLGTQFINLGWEPQWLLVKAVNSVDVWYVADTMRGYSLNASSNKVIYANLSNAEVTNNVGHPTSTGFVENFNGGTTYIYIAIRRGPMKTPESGTEVFATVAASGSTGTSRSIGFSSDFVWARRRDFAYAPIVADRLRGYSQTSGGSQPTLETTNANPENAFTTAVVYDVWNDTVKDGTLLGSTSSALWYHFRRAPGFFDVVAYTGTGSTRTVSHNLGVVPELMIVKRRNDVSDWLVYISSLGNNANLSIHRTDAVITPSSQWNTTTPTASVFSTGGAVAINLSGSTYIAYLFATCPGVSKVGSYTGTGTGYTVDVNCGFTAGARFVLIKRTDSTGDWFVWDTARGIISGNDPYLLLNSNAAEVTGTDYIDPLSSGFQISSTAPAAINANGGSFIFLAIA